MSVSLSEFIKAKEIQLRNFKHWWELMHEKDPEGFPMEFDDDNDGMWFEQFQCFNEDTGQVNKDIGDEKDE